MRKGGILNRLVIFSRIILSSRSNSLWVQTEFQANLKLGLNPLGCGSSDIIVMGTHGRTGLSRLLMGSVAEAVSRKAHCPVLTVKHPFPETSSGEPAA